MRTALFTLLLAATAASACRTEQVMPPVDARASEVQAAVDRQFTLGVGREARIGGSAVRVRFAAVVEDSRCPSNAVCAWQGNAGVRLELSGAGESRSLQLNTALEPQIVEYGGMRFRLVGLTPYPVAGQPAPAPGSYEATLLVTR